MYVALHWFLACHRRLDQPRKGTFSPIWDHLNLITEKVKDYSLLVYKIDHFPFGLFQFIS